MFPSKTPLAAALAPQGSVNERGFGLLGIIVTLALSTAVVGVVYTVYNQGEREREVAEETTNTQALSRSIQTSFASSPSYTLLNETAAEQQRLFPTPMLSADGVPLSTWGGAVLVAPVDLTSSSGTIEPGEGFAITYEGVPTATCVQFASDNAAGFDDTKINGNSVISDKTFQMNAAINQCGQATGSTVQFIRAKQGPAGPINPNLTPCAAPPSDTRNVACPTDQLSSIGPAYSPNGITQQQDYSCNNPYGAFATRPWYQTGSTCVPMCHAPASVPASQSQGCPAGQVTIASGAASFTQTQVTTYSCQTPVGPVVPSTSPWTPLPSAACAPKCVPPAPSATTRGSTGTCPAGQVVASGAPTFGQTEAGTINYTCNGFTGSSYASTTAWSGSVTPAAGSVCAPKCIAPAPTSVAGFQNVAVNAGCPAGYTGSHTYLKQQVHTTTTTYACPAPQGAFTSGTSVSGWSDTGAISSDNNTCTAPPPPPSQTLASVMLEIPSRPDENGQINFQILQFNSLADCNSQGWLNPAGCAQLMSDAATIVSKYASVAAPGAPVAINTTTSSFTIDNKSGAGQGLSTNAYFGFLTNAGLINQVSDPSDVPHVYIYYNK